MCWNAETSLVGFVGTLSLSAYVFGMRGKVGPAYNRWTAIAMATVALIQLLEFAAWRVVDCTDARRRVARLLEPTLVLQPCVQFACASFALGAPWLLLPAAAYGTWVLYALVRPSAHADIHRGATGHLAWFEDARVGSPVLGGTKGLAYLVGLFAPLILCVLVGDMRYGAVMASALALTCGFSVLAYPASEWRSMWCFWGLALSGVGIALNY